MRLNRVIQLEMQAKQEKERRVFFEQSKNTGSDSNHLKKIDQLEAKISEYRHNEIQFLSQIKQLEEELETKDEEIDTLLTNLENNDLLEKFMKVTAEKEDLEKEIGTMK
jgi:chromosome segregation ATPase